MDDAVFEKIAELINTSKDSEALAACDRLLKSDPNDARALCFKGDIYILNEIYDEAYSFYKKAYDINVACYDAVKGMANSLALCGKYYQAVKIFEKALNLRQDDAVLWEQYAECLIVVKYYKMANKAFAKAMEINPEIKEKMYIRRSEALAHFADSDEIMEFYKEAISVFPQTQYLLFSYASFLLEVKKDYDRAFSYYIDAIAADKSNCAPSVALSDMLYRLNITHKEKSIDLARRWFAFDKNNSMARHTYYALCSHTDEGFRFDPDYVEKLFDSFSDTFDEILPSLSYALPTLFAEISEKMIFSPEKQFDILDAGCGTGMCGEIMVPFKNNKNIKTLTGVDLSAGMLAKAEEKNIYDYLVKDNMVTFMQGNVSSFDMIMSADVLIYNGDLEPVISAVWHSLREEGVYLFSVSVTDDDDYIIDNSGRYFHNPFYVKKILKKNKFIIEYAEKCAVRMEFGTPEYGMIFVARKPKLLRSYL